MSCPSCGHSEYYFSIFTGHDCPNPGCCHYRNGSVSVSTEASQVSQMEEVVRKVKNLLHKECKDLAIDDIVNTGMNAVTDYDVEIINYLDSLAPLLVEAVKKGKQYNGKAFQEKYQSEGVLTGSDISRGRDGELNPGEKRQGEWKIYVSMLFSSKDDALSTYVHEVFTASSVLASEHWLPLKELLLAREAAEYRWYLAQYIQDITSQSRYC